MMKARRLRTKHCGETRVLITKVQISPQLSLHRVHNECRIKDILYRLVIDLKSCSVCHVFSSTSMAPLNLRIY